MGLEISVDISGPFFNGIAALEIESYCRHLEQKLGDIGVTRIRHYLPTQYMYLGHHGGTPKFNKIPIDAGALQAAIHTDRQVKDSLIITDSPVTYGAWIEGVDDLNLVVWPHHRNPPARRFPGYHTFRIITQILNSEAEGVALRELPPYLRAMNA